jgi:small subunit ribosomal protein S6
MIFIVHPNVPEGEMSKVTDKVTSVITQRKGEVITLKEWGKKRFAYKVKKSTKGYYFLLYFMATPAVLAELERTLRIDEKILRYQTIRMEKEKIAAMKAEMIAQNQVAEESPPPLDEESPVEKQGEQEG